MLLNIPVRTHVVQSQGDRKSDINTKRTAVVLDEVVIDGGPAGRVFLVPDRRLGAQDEMEHEQMKAGARYV